MERLISEEQFLLTWRDFVRVVATTIQNRQAPCAGEKMCCNFWYEKYIKLQHIFYYHARAAVTTIEDCLTPCWRVKIIT